MTSNTASPLARPFPAIPEIGGVTRRIARARYKTWDRCDLTFMTFDEGTSVAGVLTDWFLFASDCLRISPPLIISEEQIKKACEVIVKACD